MNIRINNLSKKFKKEKALDNFNLTIDPGIHGLLGPNGAGKTTLMRILATILSYDSGSITDEMNNNWKNPRVIKCNIGYLPQHFGMYKYLKVKEALKNVAFMKGVTHEKEQVQYALETTNLTTVSEKKVGQLSGGMLRRLGIAQAILGQPKLLILDEPSVGLDPSERINLRKIIRDYNNGERIILLSSHIVSDLESVCDNLTIMNNGIILCSDSLDNIRKKAEGKVAVKRMSEKQLRFLEHDHDIINFTIEEDVYTVRYLINEDDDQSEESPNLEDSYTYIIRRARSSQCVL